MCKTECVRAGEHTKRLLLKRRLVSLDDVGHVLVTTCMPLDTRGSTRCDILGAKLCANSLFLCDVQCAVRKIRTAERQFQAPHIASDSRRESSRSTWSESSLKAVVAEHPISQQVGISCALRHTRLLHEIDDNQTRTEKSNSWMYRKTTLRTDNDDVRHHESGKNFLRCSSPQYRGFGSDTSRCPPKTKSSKAECEDSCLVKKQKQARTSRSFPLHSLH